MSSVPYCAWVRGYVLNSLEDGPVRVADLIRFGETEFGFSRGEIQAAGQHFAVIAQDRLRPDAARLEKRTGALC
jgi:hypothetical protein